MAQIRIGIHLASLGQPFKSGLVTAARLGADAVEIDARHDVRPAEIGQTGTRQLKKYLDDYRLRVSAVEFRTRRGYQIEEELDRRIDATKQAMSFAYAIGATAVVNSVGKIPSDETSQEWQVLVESLTDLGRFGQRCGAMLAADTGFDDPASLVRLLNALPPGTLGVNFSPGDLIMHGFPTLDAAEALGTHVIHVHAKDGIRERTAVRGREVPLGQGSANIPEIMAALDDRGYRGYWTIQCDSSENREKHLEQAVQFLRAI
ncbi:MAG: sugar phosphate isomerase/epimerase [Planctomycetota bacterium]|nr:sugar phosphate isomerase/epimerase [Planctomycetota bacterium]MDA1177222.1 sugar phosphate isomerase/epimerase [Planctomycetota bacterium]